MPMGDRPPASVGKRCGRIGRRVGRWSAVRLGLRLPQAACPEGRRPRAAFWLICTSDENLRSEDALDDSMGCRTCTGKPQQNGAKYTEKRNPRATRFEPCFPTT